MISQLIITSLIILGIHNAVKPGMIFYSTRLKIVGFFITRIDPNHWEKVEKMLFICPPCMASIYGTIAFLFTGQPIIMYIPFIFALSGLNYIFAKI